ncbi:hypothetical protein SAMN05216388_100715 [Halorientalis persicus]|uniref:N-terminal domain-containing protein n=1 Tax=Halorientalis persicus TaxID=1367881 RepID=A0A1H8L4V2_9EURY|nr:ArdC-like ssDNA-binding domain-containing protein [Halorientalis persicus]SEO00212.1 hypothetical protein SAMN05216388_100715 [Halorientalis persicus]
MATSDTTTFDDRETRDEQMRATIDEWVETLTDLVDEAQASAEFQEWLDVQSRFHEYSHRNTLLIKQQCPEATKVAGYRTWQEEFDRHVSEGESAIWIWAPIITTRCPECENAPSYHEESDCEYDETPPEDWDEGLVGFKPAPVFDVSQTEGEPLPELDTQTYGDGSELVDALQEAASALDVEVRIVAQSEWTYSGAKGVCSQSGRDEQPIVKAKNRDNEADLVTTLIHEYAHALLHFQVADDSERAKREVEAEAVAYVVGRYFCLDTSNAAFYLAVWADDQTDTITDRLQRISTTATTVIDAVDDQLKEGDTM